MIIFRLIREQHVTAGSTIINRTAAHNRKSRHATVQDEKAERSEVLSSQVKLWRAALPDLINKFRKLPDKRHPASIKHKVTVLMVFGLFAFIFRLQSRREMNRELTAPAIQELSLIHI